MNTTLYGDASRAIRFPHPLRLLIARFAFLLFLLLLPHVLFPSILRSLSFSFLAHAGSLTRRLCFSRESPLLITLNVINKRPDLSSRLILISPFFFRPRVSPRSLLFLFSIFVAPLSCLISVFLFLPRTLFLTLALFSSELFHLFLSLSRLTLLYIYTYTYIYVYIFKYIFSFSLRPSRHTHTHTTFYVVASPFRSFPIPPTFLLCPLIQHNLSLSIGSLLSGSFSLSLTHSSRIRGFIQA